MKEKNSVLKVFCFSFFIITLINLFIRSELFFLNLIVFLILLIALLKKEN